MESLDAPSPELLSMPNELLFNIVRHLDMWATGMLAQTCTLALQVTQASDSPEIRSCLVSGGRKTLGAVVREAKAKLFSEMRRCPHVAFLFFAGTDRDPERPVDVEAMLKGFPSVTHVVVGIDSCRFLLLAFIVHPPSCAGLF